MSSTTTILVSFLRICFRSTGPKDRQPSFTHRSAERSAARISEASALGFRAGRPQFHGASALDPGHRELTELLIAWKADAQLPVPAFSDVSQPATRHVPRPGYGAKFQGADAPPHER